MPVLPPLSRGEICGGRPGLGGRIAVKARGHSNGRTLEASPPVTLVWVTGTAGVGKSTACAEIKARHHLAVHADWEGYSHWVDRASGHVVVDPPYPVPAGWLERFVWRIDRAEVEALAGRAGGRQDRLPVRGRRRTRPTSGTCLTGWSAWWLTTRRSSRRLLTRTSATSFGKHPDELAAVLARERHGRGELPAPQRDDHRRHACPDPGSSTRSLASAAGTAPDGRPR